MLMRALSVHVAHEIAGAARIRHSLRPLNFGEGVRIPANLGRNASRDRETASAVIARSACDDLSAEAQRAKAEAIHSSWRRRMDCFASLAMTVLDAGRPIFRHSTPKRVSPSVLQRRTRP